MKKLKVSEWIKKNWKKLLLLVLVHLAVFYVAYCFYTKDYYERKINLSDFTAQSDQDASVETAIDADAYFSLKLSGNHPADFESSQMTVPIGYYYVYVQYETEQDCSLESYSSTYLNQDNSLGNTFGGMVLPADHTTAEGPIWVDQDAHDFIFRLHYNGGRTTVYNITLKSMKPYPDAWWYCSFAVLLEVVCFVLYYRGKKKGTQRSLCVWLYLLAIALIASLPLMNDFGLLGDDLAFHIDRIKGISYYLTHFTWSQPIMRVNEVSGNGGGYVAPIFYPQVLLFFPGMLYAMGCSMMTAYKLYIFWVNLCTVGMAYFSFKKLSGNWETAAVGSAAYTLALYHLTNIYYRAAVGEYTAMIFLPLFFWAMYEITCRDYRKWPYLELAVTGLLGSHILTTALCVYFALAVILYGIKKLIHEPKRILALFKSGVCTVLLNAWFLIPFLQCSTLPLEIFQDPDKQSDVANSVVYISQMFNTHVFERGGSGKLGNTNGEMPLSIGLLLLFIALLYIVLCRLFAKDLQQTKDERCIDRIAVLGALVAILGASYLCPWKQLQELPLPGIRDIQFSWRLFSFASMFLSYIFGRCFGLLTQMGTCRVRHREGRKILLPFILAGSSFLLIAEIHPYLDSIQNAPIVSRTEMEMIGEPDFLYSYFRTNHDMKNIEMSDFDQMEISSLVRVGTKITFQMRVEKAEKDSWVKLPVDYFQGYHLYSDGKEVPIESSSDWKIMFRPSAGEHSFTLEFREWKSWKLADVISVCSAAGTLAYWLFHQRKRRIIRT